MKIRYILLMAAMMAAGACTSDRDGGRVGEPVPIQLTATVEGETAFSGQVAAWTRADHGPATRGIQEESIASGETVYLWADKAAAGTYAYLKAWNLTSNGSGGFTGSTMYYPTDGSSLTFRAVHGNFSSAPAEGTAIGSLTHSVIADQSASGAYEHSDLMYGAGSGSWESAGTVSFGHKLSKIEVNLSAGTGLTPDDLASVVVQIRNVKPSVTINPVDGTVGSASGDAITVTARRTGTLYEAVIPPQALAAGSITVTRSGITVTVPLAVASFAANSKYVYNVKCTNKGNRPKLPIEYIAPYNMTSATAMATDNQRSNSMYFSWNSSTASSGGVGSGPKADIQKMINGTAVAGYHLPSKAEWCSIVAPYYAQTTSNTDTSMGGNTGERITYKVGQHTGMTETVAWGVTNNNTNSTWSADNYAYEVNQVFYNDYNCPNDAAHTYIGYGLRFKPTASTNGEYTCGYRYEYKSADASVGGGASLTVMVKYVGANQDVTIATVSDESWWATADFTLVLPAGGNSPYTNGSNQAASYYSSASTPAYGSYWSATVRDASYVHDMHFDPSNVVGNNRNRPGYGFFVRLFKDAE